MEITYYRIVLLGASIKLSSTAVGQFMLGVDRPNPVLFSAVFGVAINAFGAWCVVLGHLGFSKQGIVGAAWMQNLGTGCELLALFAFAMLPRIRKKYAVLPPALHLDQLFTLVKIGIPSGLQFFSDVLAWSIFCNGVIGILGPAAMQANTFMLGYMVVSFMPAFGLSSAVTALVGRYIGSGQPEISARRAHLGFWVTLIYSTCCGAIFILARGPLMRFFTDDPLVIRVGGIYLIYAAIYEIFDAMYIVYSGALRGAGDTLVPGVVMAVLCWTISIGGGFVAAIKWPDDYGAPWLVGCIYGAALGIFMILRFVGGKWKRIVLERPVSNVALPSATLT
jgi:MATE family multidrug resistance protein